MYTILITKITAKIDINGVQNAKPTHMIQNNVKDGVIFTKMILIGPKTAETKTKINIITKQSLLIKASNNQIKPHQIKIKVSFS